MKNLPNNAAQAAAILLQQFDDDQKALHMALARMVSVCIADAGKSLEELKAESLVEIRIERVRKEAQQRTAAQLATAVREGTHAALAEHARAQPAPAKPPTLPAPVAPSASDAPVVQTAETKEQRQDRRLQACIDAGLPMEPQSYLSRLPDGVGDVADKEGITRQAFSTDIRAALKRRESARREGATVHRA